MALIDYSEVTSDIIPELIAAASEAWPLFAIITAILLGKGLFVFIAGGGLSDEVHSGREDEYEIPDDGYHDKYGGSAEDYISDNTGGGFVTNGDWREAIRLRENMKEFEESVVDFTSEGSNDGDGSHIDDDGIDFRGLEDEMD